MATTGYFKEAMKGSKFILFVTHGIKPSTDIFVTTTSIIFTSPDSSNPKVHEICKRDISNRFKAETTDRLKNARTDDYTTVLNKRRVDSLSKYRSGTLEYQFQWQVISGGYTPITKVAEWDGTFAQPAGSGTFTEAKNLFKVSTFMTTGLLGDARFTTQTELVTGLSESLSVNIYATACWNRWLNKDGDTVTVGSWSLLDTNKGEQGWGSTPWRNYNPAAKEAFIAVMNEQMTEEE